MREFILAMRAIWATWHEGEPLQFAGRFYTHTLMTPFFTPTNREFGAPRVFLAAVGPLMTEVAGEVADGIIVHPFTTETYLRETTLPALERGFAKARASGVDKSHANFEVSYPCFVVTGRDEQELQAAKQATRQQIAFYGSTPGLQARPGQRRCRRTAGRIERHVQAGAMGRHGQPHRRRPHAAVRGGGGAGSESPRRSSPASVMWSTGRRRRMDNYPGMSEHVSSRS